MVKVYILCYKIANELTNIKLYTSLDKAMETLRECHATHQILEYHVLHDVSERPLFVYTIEDGLVLKYSLKTDS
jgi:hypothetical protein